MDFIWFGDKCDGDFMPEENDDKSNHLAKCLNSLRTGAGGWGVFGLGGFVCMLFLSNITWRHQHFLLTLIFLDMDFCVLYARFPHWLDLDFCA